MVELLIKSDIAKYCEFKSVTRVLTLLNGKLQQVSVLYFHELSVHIVLLLTSRQLL